MNNTNEALRQLRGFINQLSDEDQKAIFNSKKTDSSHTANLDEKSFEDAKKELISKLCQK